MDDITRKTAALQEQIVELFQKPEHKDLPVFALLGVLAFTEHMIIRDVTSQ